MSVDWNQVFGIAPKTEPYLISCHWITDCGYYALTTVMATRGEFKNRLTIHLKYYAGADWELYRALQDSETLIWYYVVPGHELYDECPDPRTVGDLWIKFFSLELKDWGREFDPAIFADWIEDNMSGQEELAARFRAMRPTDGYSIGEISY